MEKVESGVRLSQQQQLWIAFIYTLLEQGKSLIVLTEPPVQVCKRAGRTLNLVGAPAFMRGKEPKPH